MCGDGHAHRPHAGGRPRRGPAVGGGRRVGHVLAGLGLDGGGGRRERPDRRPRRLARRGADAPGGDAGAGPGRRRGGVQGPRLLRRRARPRPGRGRLVRRPRRHRRGGAGDRRGDHRHPRRRDREDRGLPGTVGRLRHAALPGARVGRLPRHAEVVRTADALRRAALPGSAGSRRGEPRLHRRPPPGHLRRLRRGDGQGLPRLR